ncbi:MAG: RHS repeat-associated core domain-containing protein, partial [Candidatus Oxydemutatoraceae bacterium WSBS_2016_MAG_OTU14]
DGTKFRHTQAGINSRFIQRDLENEFRRLQIGDFNGDRIADIYYAESNTEQSVYLSDGTGSYVQLPAPALPDVSGAWRDIAPRLQFLDLNGDQATDIYYFHDDTSQDQIWSLAGTQWQTFEAQLGETEKRGVKDIERVVFLDVNGDGIVDAYTLPAHQYKLANVYWGKFKLPLVVSITNGLGLEQAVTYAPLSTVHVPAQFDEHQDLATLFNRALPLWVVTQQSRLGQVSERYRYHGSQLHTDGFGFLGFSEVWREDVTRGIQERTRYDLKYPYIGKVLSEAQFLIQAQATEASANMDQATLVREKTIVHSHQTYHAGKVLFPHLKTVTQQEYDLAGQWMTSTKEAFEKYDEYGDVNRLVKVIADGKRQFVETTLREYVSHALEPTIRLLKRQAIHYADGVHEEIRHVSEFEYGDGYLPIKKTIQPQHPLSTIQTYRYDRFGNLIYFAVATADDEQSKRATHLLYEPGGRYITAQTNVQGHRQTFVHDPQLQQATLIVDANGREQHNTYDAWGRLRQRHHFDGTVMMIDYSNKQPSLTHPESVYFVREQQQGGMTREYHYDRKQQRMREIVQGMDQERNIRDHQYDAVGRVIATSLPFQEQDAVKIWTYREYDARDRLLKERTPYPGYHASFTVNYVKNTEYRSNRLNQLQSIIRDGLGRVISVVDAQGSASHFEYDPLGNLLRMSPPDGAETVMQYDVFGNRLSLDSPYRGHWQYRYDAWGQKLSEANIQFKRSYVYDRLGRTIQRQENDAVAEWIYDTAPNGIGHLAEKRFDGHIQKYTYDQYSRLASFADGNYLTQWHYDGANRIARIDYPGGFSVEHEYSLEGYLSRLHLIPAKLSGVPSKPPNSNEMVEDGVGQVQQLPRFKQAQREYQTRRNFYANLAQQEVSSQWRQTLQTAVDEMDTALVQLQKTLPKTMRDYDWPLCRDIAVEKIETATASLSLAQQESLLENRLRRIFIQQLLDEIEIYLSCANTADNAHVSEPGMASVSSQATPNTQQRVPLWTVIQRDEFSKVINTRHGNGWETRWLYNVARQAMAIQTSNHRNDLLRDLTYYYDELGNIVDRHDKENDIDEYFNYDELNRLNAATAIHGSQTLHNLSYQYSAGGSIVNHSEHGEYTYNNASAPQQVTSFNNEDYQHDAMGNLVVAGDFSAQWGSMHNPLQMQRGKHKVTHRFDADGHIVARNFSTGKAIYHGGDLYTEIHDGTDINRCGKIYAGKVIAAIYCVKNQQTDQVYYLHRDVLGSIDTVSNQQGRLLARFEYEPFGQRRHQQGQLPIDLGYTGHEHYSELGLIDMKGRWYDPQRGQFLSPDPNIPSPLATQSYHQYSYALNNPLRYNDPSGFFFKKIFKKIGSLFRQVIRFVKQNYRVIITTIASYYGGTLIADSFISTASKQLIWSPGAMASGAYMQAYQNILLQGTMIAGASGAGISSTLAGGNLRQVLVQSLSGGLTCVAGACVGGKILTPDRVATNAVLNGVTAMASGGSFKNAALTGLAGGVLRSVALQFRSQQIAQSMLNPENAGGLSVGLNGDQFKLGGNRYAYGMEVSGTFGGLQGGQGELLGQSYLSGSWQDHLVEAFAGPHDALNNWYWYDRVGNARPFTSPFLRWIGEGINLTNIYLATPFAIASTTPGYFYSLPH